MSPLDVTSLRPRVPERIVCLTEEPTEILYALGEQDRIVGISAYTVRPPEARRDKPVVSAFIGGSVEKIHDLRPDLCIGFSDIQGKLARELIEAGLQVLIFNQRSLREICEVVLTLGRLVDAGDRARVLVDGYVAGIEATRTRADARSHRPRVYFEEWDDPQICGIRWVSELIEIAGGVDVFAERARSAMAADRTVDPSLVVEAAPEVVAASWCGKPFDAEAFAARPGYDTLPAVRTGRVHEIDAALVLQPGPACLTDGLAALERVIAGAEQSAD
jgi:iron complex transport system substrate-binding protein